MWSSVLLVMPSVEFVDVDELVVSRCNVRRRVDQDAIEKLMENIRLHGLLNPLIVRKENGKYGIICGRLRYEAIKRIKREMPSEYRRLFPNGIPVIIKEISDREAIVLSLSENLRQNTMSKEEIGYALYELQRNYGFTMEDIMRELQMLSQEVEQILKVWRAVSRVKARTRKPGRPRKAEPKRAMGSTAAAIIDSVSHKLESQGIVSSAETFAEKLAKLSEGLSTREVQLLASRLRANPEIAKSEKELRKVVEDIKSKRMVERIVLIREDLADRISRIAISKNMAFDDVLNEAVEKGLEAMEAG